LPNSLANGLKIPKNDIIPLLEKAGIDPKRRAETLTIDEWGILYKEFKNTECG
jgi:16S rRNA A1518/A1519 N6-dimethyltransferase RsmA/KsgA/DIM1 with predicted DNA glycosylase/AP lyase activity